MRFALELRILKLTLDLGILTFRNMPSSILSPRMQFLMMSQMFITLHSLKQEKLLS